MRLSANLHRLYDAFGVQASFDLFSAVGFEGDLSYEALNFIKDLPRELYAAGLAFMAEVGRYHIGRFEYHKSLGK